MPVESDSTSFDKNGHVPRSSYLPTGSTPVNLKEENELAEWFQIIRRRRYLFGGVAIAVTLTMAAWTLTRTPIYRGEFRVLVEPVALDDPSRELLQGEMPISPAFDYSTQIEVLRSPALLKPIAEKLEREDPGLSYGMLLQDLQITRLRDTKVLSVSFLNSDPERIQVVLDALSQEFLDYSFEQRQSSLRQGIQFVDGQLPELRDRVDSLQSRLERFRQEYSLIDPEKRGDELSDFISEVEKQRQQTQTALTEARSLYNSLQNQLGFNDQQALAASSLSESPRYQALLTQLRELEAKIATESARFQPDSPNVMVLEDERASLLPLLDQEADRVIQTFSDSSGATGNLTPTSLELTRQLIKTANEVRQLEARSDALTQVDTGLKQEFAIVPALARQYTELQRELAVATDSLNRFLTTRETLQIDAAQKSVPWELIAAPSVAGQPVSPNVPRSLMMGAIAGFILGGIAALVADKLDRVVHSTDDIKALTRLPILGSVPLARAEEELEVVTVPQAASESVPTQAQGDSNHYPRDYYIASPFAEAFRSLYANLRFLGSDSPIRSVVISSPSPTEGKSTVATHLAKAAAAMGQRVLLVDADLRCPQVHERLNLANLRGLSDVLSNNAELGSLIRGVEGEPYLHVLTAGSNPPDPTKLLSSRRMRALMERLQGIYSLVIYDMPPILGFADTPLLAAHADGMMLVTAIGKTRRTDLAQTIETLNLSPVNLLGIIANGVQPPPANHYNTYNYHYYRRKSSAGKGSSSFGDAKAERLGRLGQPRTSTFRFSGLKDLWQNPKEALSQARLPQQAQTFSPQLLVLSGVGLLISVLWMTQIILQWRKEPQPSTPETTPTAPSPVPSKKPDNLLDPFLSPKQN
ncbi:MULTISPECIES: polysaccharide biosynthesis tyrosine autokinase [unclassified Leptolyngbya]|uniref:GumC family protein n=1 Tax=unclassified Leptolyngbya TaxID=2650499 RepID=UPI001687F12A|nr:MULTISPECIES: polysaccharide biosynthesis tyrosine autokinase [unclassified Leptolyngbya]MBD1910777.1 polysaccharide biosynthesis tyrosine autokinase [Leptolyngbya sp. FACHB-8]MBD2158853.1 polysaccharide biosynthesis tyrosine autokinase [Leptolyngbya sp. FACHB-16]